MSRYELLPKKPIVGQASINYYRPFGENYILAEPGNQAENIDLIDGAKAALKAGANVKLTQVNRQYKLTADNEVLDIIEIGLKTHDHIKKDMLPK